MLFRDLEVFFIGPQNKPKWIGAVATIPEALMVIRNQAKHSPGTFLVRSHNLHSKTYVDANQSGEVVAQPTVRN